MDVGGNGWRWDPGWGAAIHEFQYPLKAIKKLPVIFTIGPPSFESGLIDHQLQRRVNVICKKPKSINKCYGK